MPATTVHRIKKKQANTVEATSAFQIQLRNAFQQKWIKTLLSSILIQVNKKIAKKSIPTKIANGFRPSHFRGAVIISTHFFIPGYKLGKMSTKMQKKVKEAPLTAITIKVKLDVQSCLLKGINRVIGQTKSPKMIEIPSQFATSFFGQALFFCIINENQQPIQVVIIAPIVEKIPSGSGQLPLQQCAVVKIVLSTSVAKLQCFVRLFNLLHVQSRLSCPSNDIIKAKYRRQRPNMKKATIFLRTGFPQLVMYCIKRVTAQQMLNLCRMPRILTMYHRVLPLVKSNLRPKRLRKKPIKKSPAILIMFFALIGLFQLTARGMAKPMMNKNAGKMKSAGVNPSHSGWLKNQGALPPILSTRIIPTMVNPLQTSIDSILIFVGLGG